MELISVTPEKGDRVCKHAKDDALVYPIYQMGNCVLLCKACIKEEDFDYIAEQSNRIYHSDKNPFLSYTLTGRSDGLTISYSFSNNLFNKPNVFFVEKTIAKKEKVTEWASVFNASMEMLPDLDNGPDYIVLELTTHHPKDDCAINTRVSLTKVNPKTVGEFLAWNQYGKQYSPVYRLDISDVNNVLPNEDGFLAYSSYSPATTDSLFTMENTDV